MQSQSLFDSLMSWVERSGNAVLLRHRVLLRVIWAAWLAGVISGSLASGDELSSLDKVLPFIGYDKLMHFTAYAGLSAFSMLAFDRWRGLAVALSMILLGAIIEVGQRFSPGRTPDIADAITNTLGVLSIIVLRSVSVAVLAQRKTAKDHAASSRVSAAVQLPAIERE